MQILQSMKPISPIQLFEHLVDTISWCSIDILTLPDDEIAYNLFEQFDIGAQSFLHENSLAFLLKDGLITDEIATELK